MAMRKRPWGTSPCGPTPAPVNAMHGGTRGRRADQHLGAGVDPAGRRTHRHRVLHGALLRCGSRHRPAEARVWKTRLPPAILAGDPERPLRLRQALTTRIAGHEHARAPILRRPKKPSSPPISCATSSSAISRRARTRTAVGRRPGDAAQRRPDGPRAPALPARAQRLPARRPRQEHLPELRPGARLRRRLPPALRRHQSGEGRAGVRRRHQGERALARLRLGVAARQQPVLRQRRLRLHVPRRRGAGAGRPRLRRRAVAPSRCAPTAATSPRPAPTARSATARRRENLARLREMRDGKHADGAMVLRAKIDMASPNINLRDPALYRIRRAHHHNTGDRWCIYPMYTFAHPIEDALERITHSICTLEFEDQRPFYDWLLERLVDLRPAGAPAAQAVRIRAPEPDLRRHQQAQAAPAGGRRHVSGWDDPRMPTLVGMRRRGYTAGACSCWPSAPARPRTTPGSTTPGWTSRCATTSRPRPRARWPCSTRSRSSSPTGPRSSAATAHRSPAARPRIRIIRRWASAQFALGARGLDRARRLPRDARQGLPAPVPGQQGAPEVRRHRRVHRLREGRRRQRHRRARQRRSRHQERHAGRRPGQGQGHDHLGLARTTACRSRSTCTTACSPCRSPAAPTRFTERAQSEQHPRRRRASSSPRPASGARDARAVRAPRLLRDGSRRPQRRPGRCSTASRRSRTAGASSRRSSVRRHQRRPRSRTPGRGPALRSAAPHPDIRPAFHAAASAHDPPRSRLTELPASWRTRAETAVPACTPRRGAARRTRPTAPRTADGCARR